MTEPTIFRFNAERRDIVDEVVTRVLAESKDPLLLLNDAAYHEIKRLESHPGDERELLGNFKNLARSLGRMGDGERQGRLEQLARMYAWDIAGNFNPKVYRFASRILPSLVGGLLSPLQTLAGGGPDMALREHLVTQGPVGDIARLAQLGTLVFVPTHLSNFDSVVFGYGLEREQLPPATYGAGKNLFTNPLLSYFMHNLGAYRVDRRIRHQLYKNVLKAYSSVLIERGYHSLFFPGGTRSRSGGVEEKLKLGLAGTGIEAMIRTAMRGRPQKVFFVPATINYQLTLESRTLVEDWLAEQGRARYIIQDDESTQLERVLTLVRKLLLTEGSIVLRFGDPLDPFGNRVTADGRSIDRHGRTVDPLSYAQRDGKLVLDATRDAQYTRELGESICEAYRRDTVLMSTHIVAAAAFEKLREAYPRLDLFGLLRHRDEVFVPRAELSRAVGELRDRARELEDRGETVLGPGVRRRGATELLDEAVRAWSGYHSLPVLIAQGDGYLLSDLKLLLYYQNRLVVSGLGYSQVRGRGATTSGGASRGPEGAV
ncbi:MAG: 1-acyl-sn-glycerol-3-phosphate acyltransferase [Deltaproteobacteria bacterium]|nr:1-acyl-sn-glycerol-3-phosphate acyltransferase [Deltaproteobacteria bacterium]